MMEAVKKVGRKRAFPVVSASVSFLVIMFLMGGKLFARRSRALRASFAGSVSEVNRPTILLDLRVKLIIGHIQ